VQMFHSDAVAAGYEIELRSRRPSPAARAGAQASGVPGIT
jgi:hypothetical protein